MRYLTLGVFSILTLSFSCKKIVEYVQYGEFYFINETDHAIVYDLPVRGFNVDARSKIIIKQTQQGAKKESNVETYENPILYTIGDIDFITIRFDNKRCLKLTKESEHSPLNNKNYIAEKIDAKSYKFTYTFTEADYERAVSCP